MTPDGHLTALVVDDDEHIAHLLRLLLERAGYAVQVLHDGAAAKSFIEREEPVSVALLDAMMPFHDGLALVKVMRATPGWDQVPALLMVLRSREADIQAALQCGADDCIVKPLQPEDVLARVERLAQPAHAQ